MKANPCTPTADLRARPRHAAGKVLKMPHGIAQVTAFSTGRSLHDPDERTVGRRLHLQDRLIPREIRHPRLVELENRLCGFSGNPLGLGEPQGVEVELHALRIAVATGHREIVGFGNFRKPRAWRIWSNGSGDYVIAFSTAYRIPYETTQPTAAVTLLHNDYMSPLFLAAIEATEEAIVNSLFMAETTTGFQGHTIQALPREKVMELMKKYGRVKLGVPLACLLKFAYLGTGILKPPVS